MLSLYGAESPDGRRAEVGTVSDFFRLLGRIWVFLLVLCHAKCPCACFEPLWAVRGGQGSTCCHFLEPSNKKGLLMPYCDDGEENEDEESQKPCPPRPFAHPVTRLKT